MRRPVRGAPQLPPDVPPEYAEAYLRAYEQARAATSGSVPGPRVPPGSAPRTAAKPPVEPRDVPPRAAEDPAPTRGTSEEPAEPTVTLDVGTEAEADTESTVEGFRPWAFEPPDDEDTHAPRTWQFEPPSAAPAVDVTEPPSRGWSFEPPPPQPTEEEWPTQELVLGQPTAPRRGHEVEAGAPGDDEEGQGDYQWPDLVPGLRPWSRPDGAESEEPYELGRIPDWMIPVLTVALIVVLFAAVYALAR